MIFTAQHPGSWQEFMMKPENKALPIQEATRKYNSQMLMFENQYSTFLQQQQQLQSQSSSGGGPRQAPPRPFIIEVTILNDGDTIRLDATGTDGNGNTTDSDNYNCYVDWGDGNISPGVKGNGNTVWNGAGLSRHTYASAGVYEISVYGQMPVVNFSDQEDNNTSITDIKQWGDNKWENMANMFKNVTSLTNISATDSPDFSNLDEPILSTTTVENGTGAYYQFYYGQLDNTFRSSGLTNVDFLQYWDMTGVDNVRFTFTSCTSVTDWSGISNWDMSQVKYLSAPFLYTGIGDTGLSYSSTWDLASLEQLEYAVALTDATSISFLEHWMDNNDGNLKSLQQAFRFIGFDADFNYVSSWDTSNVENAIWMFGNSTNFVSTGPTSLDGIQGWDMTSLKYATSLFFDDQWLTDTSALSSWNVPNLLDASYIFTNNGNLSNTKIAFLDDWFDGTNDPAVQKLFNGATIPSGTLDLTGWFVSGMTKPEYLTFQSSPSSTSINFDVTGWDVSNVTKVQKTFYNYNNATITGLDTWNLDSLTSYFEMFENMKGFTGDGIEGWFPTGNPATNISQMLYDCDSFDVDISGWDITGITNASNFMAAASGMSTTNYDLLLVGWEATLQAAYPDGEDYPGIDSIHFGGSRYTPGGAAEAARNSLITNFGWSITDGGAAS